MKPVKRECNRCEECLPSKRKRCEHGRPHVDCAGKPFECPHLPEFEQECQCDEIERMVDPHD